MKRAAQLCTWVPCPPCCVTLLLIERLWALGKWRFHLQLTVKPSEIMLRELQFSPRPLLELVWELGEKGVQSPWEWMMVVTKGRITTLILF